FILNSSFSILHSSFFILPPATFSGQIFRFLPNYPPSFLQLTSPWRLLILEGTRCAPSGMIAAALPDQEVRAVQFSLSCQPD
ncbi:MAG TPA: hypothetical protein PKZ53_21300, partial [Acidobacteriota bacterium]|nr:hypothetical protein [Acidobacteriota bacterium]